MTTLAAEAVSGFDFTVPAEVYVGRGTLRRHGLRFKQFASAAEAIQFIMEQPRAAGETAMMECDDERYASAQVAGLYQSATYPLDRAAPKVAEARSSIAIATPATKRALAAIATPRK